MIFQVYSDYKIDVQSLMKTTSVQLNLPIHNLWEVLRQFAQTNNKFVIQILLLQLHQFGHSRIKQWLLILLHENILKHIKGTTGAKTLPYFCIKELS